MKPNTPLITAVAAATALAAGNLATAHAAAAPAAISPEAAASPLAGNFAGELEGSDAFVAVVIDGANHVVAYACDGSDDHLAEIAEWFHGAVALDGSLVLTGADGTVLAADVTGDDITGTLSFDAERQHAFSLDPVTAPAGLYRAEATVDGEHYVGGWIELANHDERGAIITRTGAVLLGGNEIVAQPSEPLNEAIRLPSDG
jgi:hypothetical protein